MATEDKKTIDERTAVPFAWVLKSLGLVVLVIPVIWSWATMSNNVSVMAKQVDLIPDIAKKVAILADRAGISAASSTPSVAIFDIPVKPTSNVLAVADSTAEYDRNMLAVKNCAILFGKGNAASTCIKTLTQ
jgi:hypothetical protein